MKPRYYIAHYTYRVTAYGKSHRAYLRADEQTPNTPSRATRYETIRAASDALCDVYQTAHEFGTIVIGSRVVEVA